MENFIRKCRKSPALHLGAPILKAANFRANQKVSIKCRSGQIVIEPTHQKQYSLDELIAQCAKNPLHDEIDFGAPVGREII
jgi:antitoxin MazE